MLVITANDEEETLAFGRRLGELVRPGDVVGLSGDLGAGKTVVVRGMAEGLGVDPDRVRSPTFTLMVTYQGGRLPLHHLDLYRLEASEDDRLALREVFFGEAVSAVEWYERLGEEIDHLAIEITSLGSHSRRIRLQDSGGRHVPLIEALRSRWR